MNICNRVLTVGAVVLLATVPAYPQNKDILRLNADVLQLQNQVKQLQVSVDEKTAAITRLVEKMADQVNGIESSVLKLADGVAGVKSSNDGTTGELRVIVNNLSANIDQVNEGLSSIRTQINSVAQQLSAKASSEPLARPEDLIREATVDKLSGNYDLAIDGFREFISKYPNDPKAPQAQYEIGDAFYNLKKFDQAVIEYDLFLQNYPNDDRTRSALYKKGLSHAELNQTPLALAALNRVVKDFPNTTESANAALKIRELNAPRRAR